MNFLPIILFLVVPTLVLGEAPHLLQPDGQTLLMLDTRLLASSENARLIPGTVSKDPHNPLFQADKPWENSMNNLYPNVLWDEQEQIFKLWYKCVLADPEAIAKMDSPSTVHDVGWYLLYATSKDGLTWDKPKLGLHRYDGDPGTNIVARDTPNVGVFKDPHDPDPSRRYKMVYDVGLGKLRSRFSTDGIHWSDPQEMLGFGARNGDTHNNAFWDERTQKYLWFTKLYLGERLVARYESDDFLHWKDNGMVLRSTIAEGRSSQTYCLPVFRYANIYLGYAMIYSLGNGRTVDCELAWSPDGLHWERVFPGTPLIPRGAKGAYDSECIYAMAGPAIAQDGQLLIFYGGDDFPHTGWKRHCLPCLARLPLDHFAGYRPVDENRPATLVTRPLHADPSGLRLTAEAHGGSIIVSALDDQGVVLAESKPITENVQQAAVEWVRGTPAGSTRLRIVLNRATLFSLGGVALVDTNLPTSQPNLPTPTPIVSHHVGFDLDSQGWKGVDAITHHAEGGQSGGYVSVTRQGRLLPIALSPSTEKESPLAGDWPPLFGGHGARLTCSVRASKPGGKVRFELFASDVAGWAYETKVPFSEAWQEASAQVRYDWSDDEARAAGWTPSAAAFSWTETIRHIGKMVVVPGAAGAQESFDLDEVNVTGLSE